MDPCEHSLKHLEIKVQIPDNTRRQFSISHELGYFYQGVINSEYSSLIKVKHFTSQISSVLYRFWLEFQILEVFVRVYFRQR